MTRFSLSREAPWMQECARLWQWWIAEIGAAWPRRWTSKAWATDSIDIYLHERGVDIVCRDRDGDLSFQGSVPIEAIDVNGWDEIATLLVDRKASLFPNQRDVLQLSFDLPRKSGRNLPAVIAIQLEQASPVEPAALDWSWTATDVTKDRAKVDVALVRKIRLDALDALFTRHGLETPPVWAELPTGRLKLRAGRSWLRSPETRLRRRAAFLSAGLLASLPLMVLLGAMLLTALDRAELARLRNEIRPKVEARQAAEQNAQLWRAFGPLQSAPAAALVLSELGLRAPSGASIENIDYEANGSIGFDLVGTLDTAAMREFVSSPGTFDISLPDELPDNAARIRFKVDVK